MRGGSVEWQDTSTLQDISQPETLWVFESRRAEGNHSADWLTESDWDSQQEVSLLTSPLITLSALSTERESDSVPALTISKPPNGLAVKRSLQLSCFQCSLSFFLSWQGLRSDKGDRENPVCSAGQAKHNKRWDWSCWRGKIRVWYLRERERERVCACVCKNKRRDDLLLKKHGLLLSMLKIVS